MTRRLPALNEREAALLAEILVDSKDDATRHGQEPVRSEVIALCKKLGEALNAA
jgi:hypothetical protein